MAPREVHEHRGIVETLDQHRDAVAHMAAALRAQGRSVDVLPDAAPLTFKVGTVSVLLRDERRQEGHRVCLEYESRGKASGVHRIPKSGVAIHLLAHGAFACSGRWAQREVRWRTGYRSSWHVRGDNGSKAVLVPLLSLVLRPGDRECARVEGDPFEAGALAFERVLMSFEGASHVGDE